MRSGRQILLDLLLNFVVYSNGNTVLDLNQLAILIAMGFSQDLTGLLVNDLLYTLAVLVLAGNLGGNFNSFEVILLFYCKSDQSINDLLYFLSLSFGGNDLAVVDHCSYLIS